MDGTVRVFLHQVLDALNRLFPQQVFGPVVSEEIEDASLFLGLAPGHGHGEMPHYFDAQLMRLAVEVALPLQYLPDTAHGHLHRIAAGPLFALFGCFSQGVDLGTVESHLQNLGPDLGQKIDEFGLVLDGQGGQVAIEIHRCGLLRHSFLPRVAIAKFSEVTGIS